MLMVESLATLHERTPATAVSVGRLRGSVQRWLAQIVTDPEAVEELTLAVSEAVENAVDHAFAATARPGTVTLTAVHVPGDGGRPAQAMITVSDNGCWQTASDPGHRGRGLALIAACCPAAQVETGVCGTRVTLRHRITEPGDDGPFRDPGGRSRGR